MIDKFDKVLNSRCSIWKKGGTGIFDDYGHESQVFSLLAEDVPCSAQPGDGKELATDAVFGIQNWTFYMRPILVDDDQVPLDIHHWLQLNKWTNPFTQEETVLVDPPDAEGIQLHNIVNIKNIGMLGHHLEIQTKLIEP